MTVPIKKCNRSERLHFLKVAKYRTAAFPVPLPAKGGREAKCGMAGIYEAGRYTWLRYLKTQRKIATANAFLFFTGINLAMTFVFI